MTRWQVGVCKRCGDPVVWAVTEAGKRMPVDLEPTEGGTIELTPGRRPAAIVHSKQAAAAAAASGTPLRTSHFATCRRADRHRRRIDDDRRARQASSAPRNTGQRDLFDSEAGHR
jgi:hypothetical protein